MVGQVFRYAVATARVDQDPTFSLRGALITPKVTHRAAAITQKDYAQVVRAVWTYKGGAITTQAAMKLMALLYPRPEELRLARWSEFDLEEKVWTIPAERAKMRREHRKRHCQRKVEYCIRVYFEGKRRTDFIAFFRSLAV